ncbi:MAG: hypothetical protein KF736_12010 [Acidobacteria bacterium]|nr:hypothetical protein [Acidobacteriota bacterium]MCW5948798.1 hypothetical protein [Pyrinomonadaceae bacterium]
MRSEILTLLFALTLSVLAVACGGSSSPNANVANANKAAVNAETTSTPANVPEGTIVKPTAETTNNAPTIGPVVQAFYEALRKKDDAGVRAVMTADFIKRSEADMRSENETSLAAFMAKYDIIDKPVEVRNEKIQGNRAVAEIKGGAYLRWTPFEFANEGGKWKYTGGSADLDAVKNQSTTGK